MRGIRTAFCVAVLVVSTVPQAPLQLNTTVRSFTPVSSSSWVADCWSYTDNLNRDFALICRGASGMSCYEVTNPSSPVFASSIVASGSDLKDVKVMQNPPTAFALQQGTETQVVSLADPYNMQVIATIPGGSHNGFVYQHGAQTWYLSSRQGVGAAVTAIWNVTNPAAPVQLGQWDPPGTTQSHDVYAQDGLMYVACLAGTSSLQGTYIVDISNPASPTQIGFVPTGTSSHAVWMYNAPGGSKFIIETNETSGGHVRIFNVDDPANPVYYTDVTTPTGGNISVHNPVVVDKYCFISWYADYLRILDMSNPLYPVEIGVYDPDPTNIGAGVFDGAWGVAHVKPIPGGHRVLMTESFSTNKGFWVIDFVPPQTPDMALSTTGAGDVSFSVSGAAPGSLMFNGISSDTSGLLGDGPAGGIGADAIFSLASAPGTQPFAVFADGSGDYSFALGPGAVPPGASFDVVNFSQTPSNGWQLSPVGRISF